MFKNILLSFLIAAQSVAFGQTVIGPFQVRSAGGSQSASSVFEVNSTTKGGISCPKMSTTQVNAISSPTEGLCAFDTTIHATKFYTGAAWVTLLTSATYTAPTIQRFTSGTAQTYTTPISPAPLYIKVKMVGGGAGGVGSGTAASATLPVAGGNTTFGSSLLTANGGTRPTFAGGLGVGGTCTISSPAVTIRNVAGGWGGGYSYTSAASTVYPPGGAGGVSFLGGNASTTSQSTNGSDAVANSGSGGSGGGGENVATAYSGSGGGAGGYLEAFITSPSATYTYTVGTGGTAGGAGTSGHAGGAGAAGVIEVEEYYQ